MKLVENTDVASSITHGQLRNSSPSSSRTLVFCPAGGVTRSFVVANVIQNMITDAAAKMAMVHWKPCISLPPPRCFTSGRTRSEMSSAPPNAPTNRKLDATVRVRDDGLITPSNDEYGTLMTV